MRRASLASASALALLLAVAPPARAQDRISGTWTTYNFAGVPNLIDLRVEGTRVNGSINRSSEVLPIFDGTVNGDAVTFKVNYADGNRLNTYTGQLRGDQMLFTRTVRVRPGGNATGAGIFGGGGPMEFVATRQDAGGVFVPRSLIGSWTLDPARSAIDPGPPVWIPERRSYAVRPGGVVAAIAVLTAAEGQSYFELAHLRADGRDYPVYDEIAVAALLEATAPVSQTRSLKAINERTLDLVTKQDGVVVGTSRIVISPDGRTFTETVKSLNPQGQTTLTSTLVFTRVGPIMPQTEE
jgi:hypothetical protein